MKPFNVTSYWIDACTPDENIQDCIFNEDEDNNIVITVNSSKGLFDLIQDLCQKISAEIQGYKDIDSTPKDDASSDIENAIDVLHQLSQHIWD